MTFKFPKNKTLLMRYTGLFVGDNLNLKTNITDKTLKSHLNEPGNHTHFCFFPHTVNDVFKCIW